MTNFIIQYIYIYFTICPIRIEGSVVRKFDRNLYLLWRRIQSGKKIYLSYFLCIPFLLIKIMIYHYLAFTSLLLHNHGTLKTLMFVWIRHFELAKLCGATIFNSELFAFQSIRPIPINFNYFKLASM